MSWSSTFKGMQSAFHTWGCWTHRYRGSAVPSHLYERLEQLQILVSTEVWYPAVPCGYLGTSVIEWIVEHAKYSTLWSIIQTWEKANFTQCIVDLEGFPQVLLSEKSIILRSMYIPFLKPSKSLLYFNCIYVYKNIDRYYDYMHRGYSTSCQYVSPGKAMWGQKG